MKTHGFKIIGAALVMQVAFAANVSDTPKRIEHCSREFITLLLTDWSRCFLVQTSHLLSRRICRPQTAREVYEVLQVAFKATRIGAAVQATATKVPARARTCPAKYARRTALA